MITAYNFPFRNEGVFVESSSEQTKEAENADQKKLLPSERLAKNQNIILAIIVVGTLMGAVDSTIVLLAFPTITAKLHSNFITSLWIILAYLLILGITTTQFGRIGDLYGRSKMFNLGFLIFTAGSVLCGFSGAIGYLIGFRVMQAIGGSLMQSNSSAIISDVFPREKRGGAFGFNALGFTVGAILGILLGGVITTFLSWQYIFFINAPIGIVAVLLGSKYLQDTYRARAKVDAVGMIILGGALALVSYGATEYAATGLATSNIVEMAVGFGLIPVFLIYDHSRESPMIDFASFKNKVLKNSMAALFFTSLGYLAVIFLVIMYLQGIRGLSPLNASLLLVPGYVAGSFLSPIMGRLSDKYGTRNLMTLGAGLLIIATLIFSTMKVDSPLYIVIAASAVSGAGASMFFPACFNAVMSNARPGAYGSVSGLLRTLQNVGLLGSFVLAISVASATIPRDVAFEIFIGTTNLSGGISKQFLTGIDSAFISSILLLIIAAVLSFRSGKEEWRQENTSGA